METHGRMSGRRKVVGAVRGAFRSAKLGWTDPQSGERLTLELDGGDGLIESLEPLGFELLAQGERADASSGMQPAVWVLHAQLERGPRERRADRAAAG